MSAPAISVAGMQGPCPLGGKPERLATLSISGQMKEPGAAPGRETERELGTWITR
ncbi:hypothetical protein PSAL_015900 [Pseudooceanicola algae]|uniref:Uncharacterized protein n=1 Tax=Pseudooceanicola algae TaxID=1537215 RepID=A0A418SH20_9RHOB|nr:hypothetical protein PSAL_015900 [Pseudooceanicola algae]